MLQAAGVSGSGMAAQLFSQAIIANNIANVITPAFNQSGARFSSSQGGGTRVASTPQRFQQGALILTGNPLDFAIGGAGFFILDGPDGASLTRTGNFTLNAEGLMVDQAGRGVRPGLQMPSGTTAIKVNAYGEVFALRGGNGATRSYVGTLQLATVANPRGLEARGDNTFGFTPATGPMVRSNPGQVGFGLIVQGGLEASSVDILDQSVGSIINTRAFQANAAVFRVASAMAGEVIEMVSPDSGRTRRATGRIDLSRSQASRLVSVFGKSSSRPRAAEEVSPELRGRLAARRMDAAQISEVYRVQRRHQPERFGEDIDRSFLNGSERKRLSVVEIQQRLQIARRQAFEQRAAG